MNNNYTKTFVVFVLASMLAVVLVPACDAQNSDVAEVTVQNDAANSEIYTIYFELNNGTDKFVEKVGTSAQPDVSKNSLSAAVKEVCAVAGYETDYTGGWVNYFTIAGMDFKSNTWGDRPYFGFAQYYLDESGNWKAINSYDEGTTVAIVFGEYKFADPNNTKDYVDSGYGWWSPTTHIDVNTLNDVKYNIYLEFNYDNKRVTYTSDAVYQSDVSKESLSAAVREVCINLGITTDYNKGWVNYFTVGDKNYASNAWGSDPYYGYAQYYLDESGNWKAINSYDEGTTVAIVFGEYKFADPNNTDDYVDSGYGWWCPASHVVIEDREANFGLYIAVAGIVVLAAIILLVLRKNKN